MIRAPKVFQMRFELNYDYRKPSLSAAPTNRAQPCGRQLAKNHHGTRCQACGFDFAITYGPMGEGFIEAHHLRPISGLEEGATVSFEAATDFAFPCSNCHRMIHRWSDPADLKNVNSRPVTDAVDGHTSEKPAVRAFGTQSPESGSGTHLWVPGAVCAQLAQHDLTYSALTF